MSVYLLKISKAYSGITVQDYQELFFKRILCFAIIECAGAEKSFMKLFRTGIIKK